MNAAYVKIWGQLVGAIAWDDKQRLATFEYDTHFKRLEWDLAPLKMPIQSNTRIFQFPELRASVLSDLDTFKGLPGMLADVLPDKYGSQLINAWLAANGRPQNSLNPVELLCFMGTRGMDSEFGFSSPNLVESETNREVLRRSQKCVVLADHTKWGVRGFSSFASFEQADIVITDSKLPKVALTRLNEQVKDVRVAQIR
jgi:hypothetical protein